MTQPSIKNKEPKNKIQRTFSGLVVSDKMNKTLVVRVENTKINPRYHKRYIVSKKYKIHDEQNKFKIGDKVTFIESRPLSKDKRWRVVYQ